MSSPSNPVQARFPENDVPAPLPEPGIVHLFRSLFRLTGRKRSVDFFLTPMLEHRNYLPVAAAEEVIPGFGESLVTLRDLPRGLWATPLVDTLTVVKAAKGFQSKRILEIGSYKGSTARLLAENTPDDTRIWTLDQDPEHGSAYRGTPLESRIHRVVGKADYELLKEHGTFDLIFVDADHDYESAYRHSVTALNLLAPGGVILWHDYQNKDYLHGGCGVPEALDAVTRKLGRSLVSIEGTMVAIYSEHAGWETSKIKQSSGKEGTIDPWSDTKIRGL
ncbi:O-methyltransferase [Luteolibacter luteus]|uniref:Class I SAM-dependent methyltransferase n=1 Tax=Luteolibacter luteus TaxID=2728835 RepID=A0A858RID4_9BACT|nr:class I SAM-dependent methyltransferase [Luteolibacter luteus]QJE96966.1 class I SAM-dependent methyltransferase [Luteolibacter luteus]